MTGLPPPTPLFGKVEGLDETALPTDICWIPALTKRETGRLQADDLGHGD